MKHWLLFALAAFWCYLPLSGQQKNRPDWVRRHPVDRLNYSGVGMAEVSEKDYQQKAKQNALSDLVSEIKVEIAAHSLLNTIEEAGSVKQTFAESIRTQTREEIEDFRLVDSWQGDNEYWVYYELNKNDYADFVEARRQKAIRNGFDFWYKGNVVLRQGDLVTAIELFSKGMDAIRPVLNQELFCSYEGKTINLATELYAALAGVFDGVAVVLNPPTVSGAPFQGIKEPVAVGVYRNGSPLRNIRLKAEFISGSGDLSSMSPTGETGVTALYVHNITSKQARQQIGISLVDDAFDIFRKGAYAALFKQILSFLPKATLTIEAEQTQVSAYVKSVRNDVDMVERTVKSLLNNNFFNVVTSPSEADVIVMLDNKCRKGNTVPGELYNFIEFFSTLGIKVTNNRTGQIMLNYSINDERTLVPESKAGSQGKNMAAREVIKRLNREFARELKKLTFDRTGKIPERQQEGPDIPVPVVDPSTSAKEPAPVVSAPIPVEIPEVTPSSVPVKKNGMEPSKALRAEWFDGVFVEFEKLTGLGDKSKIHLRIMNETADDCEVDLYSGNITIVNDKGEERPVLNLKLGSKSNNYRVNALIVPKVPTEMVIEVGKLQSVALLQLKDFKGNTIKLRDLK
ncbi:MAG TPA: LPP20 family lipoprotein [Candidatus Bacteroides intestinigallinarum]|nr:LPP20 family lipoprotein [Candidatus Bacteroides intestinigallinarum]